MSPAPMRCLAVMLLAAACGSGGNVSIDAAAIAPDEFVAPTVPHRFVVSALRLPANNNQAREYGLDLNGDTFIDNQLGMFVATLVGAGFDAQPEVTTAIDKGELIMLPELFADSLTQSPATFALFEGANPMPAACAGSGDTTCRNHLAGGASFTIAATSAHDTPLTGAIVDGVLSAGPGHVRLRVNLFGGATMALELAGARVKMQMVTSTGIATGSIAGGIARTDLDTKLLPALHADVVAAVAAACSGSGADCGCVPDSKGQRWLALFDKSPMNCAISIEEVKNHNFVLGLLQPDISLGAGQQAMSFGVQITAVSADFLP